MGIKMNFFQDNSNIDRIGALFKFKDVSDKTQTHLKNVYGNLFLCTGVCALGMYLNAFTVLQGFLWTVGIMIGMGYLTFKVADRSAPESERIGYLWAISFCMGFLVGPAMHQIAEVSPEREDHICSLEESSAQLCPASSGTAPFNGCSATEWVVNLEWSTSWLASSLPASMSSTIPKLSLKEPRLETRTFQPTP